MKHLRTMAVVGVLAATVLPAVAFEISGAGATFPYPIYAKWADAYKKETGNGLNYQSIGSGGGIKQIQNKTVTFGASDMPLQPAELKKWNMVQFPTVVGGDVPAVNLDGVKPNDLKLDGDTLARVFLGEITKWDDPAIKAQPERQASCTGHCRCSPIGRFRHNVHLDGLPFEGKRQMEVRCRRQYCG